MIRSSCFPGLLNTPERQSRIVVCAVGLDPGGGSGLRARIIIIAVKSFPLELYDFVAQSRVPKRLYCPIARIHWASSPYGILIESQLALSKRPN